MKNIRQFKLSEKKAAGIVIHPLTALEKSIHKLNEPHRDDHYLLLVARRGKYHFKIDFEDVRVEAPFVLCLEPGQVHQVVSVYEARGWAVGIEEFILEPEFLSFLETRLIHPISLKKEAENINSLLEIAHSIQNTSDTVYSNKSILFLINSFFCLLFNETANQLLTSDSKEKRKFIVEQDFKRLVKRNFKEWKSPSQYASELAISTSHLNDTIKETTGFPVSYHIQQRNIIEAKRLLYFTDLEIQETAFRLGYNDNVYFGKLFKKICGISPLAFRKQFRD